MSNSNKGLLSKGIGGVGAALLVLNGLIGAGIFALPAKMAAELGAFSPYIFLIFGALMPVSYTHLTLPTSDLV